MIKTIIKSWVGEKYKRVYSGLAKGKRHKLIVSLACLLVVTSGLGGVTVFGGNYSAVGAVSASSHEWQYTGTSHGTTENGVVGTIKHDGEWFVIDGDANSQVVTVYDTSFNEKRTIDISSETGNPQDLAVDSNGNYWVVDDGTDTVYKYDSTWGYTGTSFGITDPNNPSGIDFGPNENIFVATKSDDSVHKYDKTGTELNSYSVGTNAPTPIDVEYGPNGNWWVMASQSGPVKYDSSFSFTGVSYDLTSEESYPSGMEYTGGVWFMGGGSDGTFFEYTAGDVTYKVNGTVTDTDGDPINNVRVADGNGNNTTTATDGLWNMTLQDGTYTLTASKTGYVNKSKEITVDGAPVTVNFTLNQTELELEINRWMAHDSKQGYKVYQRTGDTLLDVTDNATVESSNSSIVEVFESNNTLVATSDVNVSARVIINATYDNQTVSKNVTVANRTLENIKIMPPEQWVASFLGLGEGPHGIASEVQWILFIVFIMSVAARMIDNPWAGIGSGMLTGILIWVLEYVSLGIVLTTTFFGIFIALVIIKSRDQGGSTVNVGADFGIDMK